MSKTVFISYARKDGTEFAERLEAWIRSNDVGLPTFRDLNDIKPGDDWKDVIDTAIDDCLVMLVVVTPLAAKSVSVTYEWAYAMAKGHKVVPLRLIKSAKTYETNVHPKLRKYNYLQFQNPDNEEWELLKEVLDTSLAQDEVPDAVKIAVEGLNHHDPEQRLKSIQSLHDFDHIAANQALRDAIGHQYPDVAMQAGMALAEKSDYKDKEAILGIERNAIEATSGSERAKAVRYLGRMDCVESAEALARVAPTLRNTNIKIVSDTVLEFKNPEVVTILRSMEAGTDLQWLRHACLVKLAVFQDTESIPSMADYLVEFSERTNWNTRVFDQEIQALEWFVKYESNEIMGTLCTMLVRYITLDNFHNRRGFTLIREALVERGDSETVEKLKGLLDAGPHYNRNQQGAIQQVIRQIEARLSSP